MNILIKTKKGYKCPECEAVEFVEDLEHLETYCKSCGLVCKDAQRVSPTQYKFFEKQHIILFNHGFNYKENS